ncbi:MAG: hypothetical protein HXX81_03125 [Campylobacterales bacterium]|nr:hypothetical protein [Campylobacterales bacterium]
MMNNLFEEFSNISIDELKQRSMNNDGDEDIELEDRSYVDFILTDVLAPAKCGVYFSKNDIRNVGLMMEEKIQLHERKRMMKQLLKSINSADRLSELMLNLKSIIDERTKIYEELVSISPSSKDIFNEHIEKTVSIKSKMDSILEEVKQESLFIE